jgi:hypothetical protein
VYICTVKNHAIIFSRINLLLFISSFCLFFVAWYLTSISFTRNENKQPLVSATHNTQLAGSLAQISEKEENETDSEKEIDSDLPAILLPFIHSIINGKNNNAVYYLFYNISNNNCEPLFLLVRNIRI